MTLQAPNGRREHYPRSSPQPVMKGGYLTCGMFAALAAVALALTAATASLERKLAA